MFSQCGKVTIIQQGTYYLILLTYTTVPFFPLQNICPSDQICPTFSQCYTVNQEKKHVAFRKKAQKIILHSSLSKKECMCLKDSSSFWKTLYF